MRMIEIYPMWPDRKGVPITVPPGAKILAVTNAVSQYHLHVLEERGALSTEKRLIVAYFDTEDVPDGELGNYIGNCAQAGNYRRWHFFERVIAAEPAATPAREPEQHAVPPVLWDAVKQAVLQSAADVHGEGTGILRQNPDGTATRISPTDFYTPAAAPAPAAPPPEVKW